LNLNDEIAAMDREITPIIEQSKSAILKAADAGKSAESSSSDTGSRKGENPTAPPAPIQTRRS
jgi:hypothetical protein